MQRQLTKKEFDMLPLEMQQYHLMLNPFLKQKLKK